MVSCTQKYSTSQYVPIQTMIYNVYLSIYFNIQGISDYTGMRYCKMLNRPRRPPLRRPPPHSRLQRSSTPPESGAG
jgi:hypothetical protein